MNSKKIQLQAILPFLIIYFLTSCISNSKQAAVNNPGSKPDKITVQPQLNKYFEECGVSGSTVIYSLKKNEWFTNDRIDANNEVLPASTFKIINLLIALEIGVIEDETQIIKWPGSTDTVRYGYRPDIYHDITAKEAFEVSAVWAFIELSKRIGKDNYVHYLKLSRYGNNVFNEKGEDFWNFGAFGVSPINQVLFLKDLYENKLPFSRRNMDIVKHIMLIEKTDDYLIRAKTGWTRDGGINTGWWVGYVEAEQDVHFFATKLIQDRKYNRTDFGQCRKEITKSILKELMIIQ